MSRRNAVTGRTVVGIVQARLSSERLPGKVLRNVAGRPMIEWVIRRLARSTRLDRVVIATSAETSDDPLAHWVHAFGLPCHRGPLHDVLARFRQAAEAQSADTVVRICGDCPLIEPTIVDAVIDRLLTPDDSLDYASNVHDCRTYPRGLDVEAMSMETLRTADQEAVTPGEREHVTPFIYAHPERFRLGSVEHSVDHSAHRWTVDTYDDWCVASRILSHFGTERFHWLEAIEWLQMHPGVSAGNAHVKQRSV